MRPHEPPEHKNLPLHFLKGHRERIEATKTIAPLFHRRSDSDLPAARPAAPSDTSRAPARRCCSQRGSHLSEKVSSTSWVTPTLRNVGKLQYCQSNLPTLF